MVLCQRSGMVRGAGPRRQAKAAGPGGSEKEAFTICSHDSRCLRCALRLAAHTRRGARRSLHYRAALPPNPNKPRQTTAAAARQRSEGIRADRASSMPVPPAEDPRFQVTWEDAWKWGTCDTFMKTEASLPFGGGEWRL